MDRKAKEYGMDKKNIWVCIIKAVFIMISAVGILSIAAPPLSVQAANRTQEEAMQWVRSQVGRSIDADGAYGAQCVDLILAYYDYLGVPRASGNGKDYAYNNLPSGWQRLQGAAPQAGDILVYGGNGSNPYGHVAIFESDRAHYHQNFNGHSYVEKITYMYNGLANPYWGVIRPAFNTNPPIAYLDLGQSFDAAIYRKDIWRPICLDGLNVVLSGEEKFRADYHWHFERQLNGSYVITSLYNGLALDVTGAGNISGTSVGISQRAQEWYMFGNGVMQELAPGQNQGLRLDVANGSTAGGADIQLFTANHTNAQIFAVYILPYKVPTRLREITGSEEMNVGDTQQLGADFGDATVFKEIEWSSSNEAVATIDASGKVTAKGPGLTTIRATPYYNERLSTIKLITVKGISQEDPPSPVATVGKVPSLKVQVAAYDKLKLTWGAVKNAGGYQVFRSTSKNGKYTQIKDITSGSVTTYTDGKRSTGTGYYYKVRAYASINGKTVAGGYSPVQGGKTFLSKPTLSVTSGTKKAVLKWGKVNGANGYVIYSSTSKNGKYKAVKIILRGSALTYTQNKLKKGKTYYYKIRAYRIVGLKKVMSADSDIKTVTIK